LHGFSGFSIILFTLLSSFTAPVFCQGLPGADTTSTAVLRADSTVAVAADSSATDSLPATPKKKGVLDDIVNYNAEDSIVVDPITNWVHLYNDAVVTYGTIKLTAGYILLDLEKDELFAKGIPDSTGKMIQKPVFTEDGKDYQTDTIRYNFKSQKAKIYKVITAESEGFLHGSQIKKSGEVYFLKQGYFTTCSHEEPHFKIQTGKAKVIPGKKIITGPAYLEVSDVPTPLVLPFGFFPTQEERASGIMIPTYVNNRQRGLGLAKGGYYFNLSEYYDLQLTGEIYTRGGWGLQGLSNYNKRYRYNGQFSMGYNVLQIGEERFAEFEPFSINRDFKVNWRHNQDPKARPDLRFSADINIASGTYYRVTSTNPNDFLNNTLNSSVSLQKSFPGKPYSISMNMRHNQNLNTNDLSITAPQLTFNMQRIFPFKNKNRAGTRWYDQIGLTYNMDAQNLITAKADSTFDRNKLFNEYSRNGIRHNMNLNTTFKVLKYFTLNPGVAYTGRMYFQRLDYSWMEQENQILTDTTSQFGLLHDFSVNTDFTTKIFGIFNFKSGKVAAVRHVMTPTITASYRPDFADPFWGYYQDVQRDTAGNTQLRSPYEGFLYGAPAAGRSGLLSFNLLNTLDAKLRSDKDSTGIKKIAIFDRLSLRTAYNMAADSFAWSPLSAAATMKIYKNLISVDYQSNFDFYGFDETLGRRVNRSALDVNGQLLRMTNTQFSVNASFRGEAKRKMEEKQTSAARQRAKSSIGVTEGDLDYYKIYDYLDYQIPWEFSFSYSENFTSTNNEFRRIQSLTFRGNIKPTNNWTLSVSSGYDIVRNELTYTIVNITRDIHCWQMSIQWVPFGFQQSYVFGVNAKANILRDAKIERRRGVGEFGF
jgi:lipopolysaccharide assembly outer membrane protein LptD (OstA)